MTTLNLGQQLSLQIVICFSFFNFVIVLMLNKDKAFSKMFGISFILPFFLGIISIFSQDHNFSRNLLIYLNQFFLIMICILSLFWLKKKYTGAFGVIVISPLISLIAIAKMSSMPSFFFSGLFQGGFTLSITIICTLLLRNVIKEKELGLTCAVMILGITQTIYFFYPTVSSYFVTFSYCAVYLLFLDYVFRKSREPYLARIKKAESKLSDINKTINIEVKKRLLEMERHNEHLLNMVQRDPLVDAYNKKGITNFLQEMVHDPSREEFTIILFDVDNFKGINDTQGHVAGDAVLKKIAGIAKQNIRGFDMLGRYGGDEFLIILPGTNISDALFVAERFRKKVSTESDISVSIGVAAFPDDGDTVTKLIEAADAGLYESKRIGKNAVSHAPQGKNDKLLKRKI